MQIKPTIIALGTMVLMTACGSSNDSASSQPGAPTQGPAIGVEYQGIWQAPGYAMNIAIGTDSINIYRHTSDYCLHINEEDGVSTDDLQRFLRQVDNSSKLEWFEGFGTDSVQAPGIHFEQISALPASCNSNVISMLDGENSSLAPQELWDLYGQIFSEYYVDFAQKDVDWQQVLHSSGADISDASDAFALFTAMEKTLEPLGDGHNYIQAEQGWWAKTLTKPTLLMRLTQEYAENNGLPFPITDDLVTNELIEDLNEFLVEQLEFQWELVSDYAEDSSDIKIRANGLLRWYENQGLGYLYIGGMTGYADPEQYDGLEYAEQTIEVVQTALDEALEDLKDVSGLIIDVRNNDGGHDFVSLAIANRFTDAQVHAYSKQARDGNGRTPLQDVYLEPYEGSKYTGPIVLLTSASTVSAAEVFALSMSQLPHVTLVGETSHGAFSDVLEWRLPNGFNIGLSNEFYLSPQGEWFEGTGVPVDVTAPFFTPEQRIEEIDLGLEIAIAIFND